jgi:hypothetical protein
MEVIKVVEVEAVEAVEEEVINQIKMNGFLLLS